MAEKNFARSGTADTDLLADDDPLAELARLVGYEPRPVQDVGKPSSEPVVDAVEAVPRRDNPVLALEDELMRAFEQYDAPSRVAVERAAPRHVEPVFDEPEPVAQDHDAVVDEVPTRDVAASDIGSRELSFEEPSVTEQAFEPSFEDALIVGDPQYGATSSDVDYREPVFEEPVVEPSLVEDEVFADVRPAEPEPELEFDPALLLADELETAVHEDVPSVEAEPTAHAGLKFVERLEPRFEQRSEPVVESYSPERTAADERQPAFLGFQPHAADENPLDDVGLDLERELELSIGEGFADDLLADDRTPREHSAEASFVEPLPVTVEAGSEPNFDGWMPDEAVREDAEPFHAEPVYARDEPHFVAEMPFENREDRARAVAEAETQWQAAEPALDAEPDYRVESVEPGQNDDRDVLLTEVERYPVPETRSSFAAVTATPRTTGSLSSIFGRATPVAHRQPVAEHRQPVAETARTPFVGEPVQSPVAETRHEPVAIPTPAAAEPEVDFENLDFDLSDIELDLSDFSLDDEPVKQEVKAEVARPVEAVTPVRREPVVAVPVSTYTAPQPVVTETADGALPFDPAMIADTDEGVSPVTELDVPQLPVIEKEKPPVYQPDYDFDIDAEMAQLFTEPSAKVRTEDLQAGVAAGAVAAAVAQPTAQINDVDDFERALEEDFRRSLSQPERMAIPVDPGQASTLYTGDGYDDEQARPRRGLLIAASIAALLLVGGGGVYAWTAFSGGAAGSGEPRVILADKEPVKVVPEEKGGKTVPNQDKAVYDRVAGDAAATPQQEQLVTSTEEPVDVVQRTLTPETLPFDGPEDGVEAVIQADDENRLLPGVDEPQTATAEGGKPLVSPRKVKTMIVKPDGTLVAREETVTEPVVETADIDAKATATTGTASGEAVATANATVDANASLSAEQAAGEGQPRSALAEVADAQVDDTAPVRTVKTTTIGATATSTDSNTPVPETRPIDQPVTVVGTVTENGNVSGTQTAEAKPAETRQTAEQTQVAAVAPGSYVIQIASLPSEAEAQKSYNSLSSKFSSVIGGRGVDIKKAEIPNKGTFFRVRIPAGSREEANSLCSRYKSAGGSCLVTR
ncbi:SPOR domain-containing protein [Shinella sp.]|uniref:SPOR domain-containing protein n=1 Tax=Shinella sp. TaxID=1870904 RepID=UPI0029B84DFA|nr:SPOR domain-containing protein [Shinella sp.]MDX3976111.1 SPOR domain-containing protein [Shinella sp.]